MRPTSLAGIRMTKVGLWFVLFTLLVGVAATNTGNNAMYMVLSLLLSTLVVTGLLSRANLRRIEVEIDPPAEIFANSPFEIGVRIVNRGRLLPRWFLLLSIGSEGTHLVIPYLPRWSEGNRPKLGHLELLMQRRGQHRVGPIVLWSLFPMGLFRKGRRRGLAREVLVYPELFPASSYNLEQAGRFGDDAQRRPGWGYELHALRGFRTGDDPRGIHWKQTARTGNMIFTVREAEESRRLSVVIDNAVGPLEDEASQARFEQLVSEAATAACAHLDRGYEVELVTRDLTVPFAPGRRQRRLVLEALALLETRPYVREPLLPRSRYGRQLRLVLDPTAQTDSGRSPKGTPPEREGVTRFAGAAP